MFIEKLKNEITQTILQETENGALAYKSSGKALVDLNFRISSYRNLDENKIFSDFMEAYNENKMLAMRWLFYARDVRGGLGERRLFRVILVGLERTEIKVAEKVLPLVAAFGRWDDLFVLMGTRLEKAMLEIVAKQLVSDLEDLKAGRSVSLLAKWMPSTNCSNRDRKNLANKMVKAFGVTPKEYRKSLSALRGYLNIVERKMSTNQWEAINYEGVPSRANLLYNPAFLKHDETRRRQFLGAVEKGEATIHGGTNFPHDIVHKYEGYAREETGLEVLWKALPDYGKDMENTLVVADGSGSMFSTIGNTKVQSIDVANSLAIYFAERCVGGFQNQYITFSEHPQLVNLGDGTLYSKIQAAKRHNEVANTNIQAVFELILNTAIKNKMRQEELPATILIISDMEFDGCTSSGGYGWGDRDVKFSKPNKTLFAQLGKKYTEAGYKLPKLAFWNVMSRTMTTPIIENDAGVILVSGFGPAAIKMVLGNAVDPYEALIEILKNPKYDVVEEALR